MILRYFLNYLIFVLAFSGNANAEQFETQTLFSKGAWLVDVTHDTSDGDLWCSASTRNRNAQSLSVTAYDNRTMTLFIFDPGWSIADRPLRFLVDVDYSRWTMDGHGSGIAISVAMNDPDTAFRFLDQIMQGSAVAVFNADVRRLATFSLSGSYASIAKLFECWNQISSVESDPFQTSRDPFE